MPPKGSTGHCFLRACSFWAWARFFTSLTVSYLSFWCCITFFEFCTPLGVAVGAAFGAAWQVADKSTAAISATIPFMVSSFLLSERKNVSHKYQAVQDIWHRYQELCQSENLTVTH